MKTCISCGMPLRSPEDHARGDVTTTYCKHCAREDGAMKSYDEVLTGMSMFLKSTQGLDGDVAKGMARDMLAKNPAWSNR